MKAFASLLLIALVCCGSGPVAAATQTTATVASPAQSIVLPGSAFKNPQFDPPQIEARGMQLLRHFGALTAEADLPTTCSRVSVHLKPRLTGDGAPVVSLLLERRGRGKYTSTYIFKDDVVTTETTLTRKVVVEPGLYHVTLQFFKASNTQRPHLELHSVTLEP